MDTDAAKVPKRPAVNNDMLNKWLRNALGQYSICLGATEQDDVGS